MHLINLKSLITVAQSLQNIIWTQIQTHQTGENGKKPGATGPPSKGKPPTTGAVINQGATPTSSPPTPAPDNAQAALVILLAAQMQAQMGNNHPSLLGNPQMLATLQNLIRQNPPAPGPAHGPNGAVANAAIIPIQTSVAGAIGPPPASHFPFPQNHPNLPEARKPMHANGAKNGYIKPSQPSQKVKLLYLSPNG